MMAAPAAAPACAAASTHGSAAIKGYAACGAIARAKKFGEWREHKPQAFRRLLEFRVSNTPAFWWPPL